MTARYRINCSVPADGPDGEAGDTCGYFTEGHTAESAVRFATAQGWVLPERITWQPINLPWCSWRVAQDGARCPYHPGSHRIRYEPPPDPPLHR